MYRLTQFGSISLVQSNQVDVIGSGETPTAYHALPDGGALDDYGSRQMHPGTVERTKQIRISSSAAEATFLQLLGLRGKRDKLYRLTDSGLTHWMYARLVDVQASRDYQLAKYRTLQDMTLRFITQETFWRGTEVGWFLDQGYTLNAGLNLDTGATATISSSPQNLTITVGYASDAGRAPVRSMVITVYAGDAAMSDVTISRKDGESITFTGTIPANSALIIDTGTMQVMVDGQDAYQYITFSPTADMAAWFTLPPGVNGISVFSTGGGTGRKFEFVYQEAWY